MTKFLLLSLLALGCSAFAQAPEQGLPPPPPGQDDCPAKGDKEMFRPQQGPRNKPPMRCGHMMKDPKEMRALVKKARSGDAEALKELKAMIVAEMDSHIAMIEKRIQRQGKDLEKAKAMLEKFKADKELKAQQVLKSILSNEKMGKGCPCQSGKDEKCGCKGPQPKMKRCPMGDSMKGPCCGKEGAKEGCCPMERKSKGPCCDAQSAGPKGKKCECQGEPKGKNVPPPPPPPEGDDAE